MPEGTFFNFTEDILRHQQDVTFICHGVSTVIRCEFGVLQPKPRCKEMEPEVKSLCARPESLKHPAQIYNNISSDLTTLDFTLTTFPNGTVLHFSCNDVENDAAAIRCENGEWISLLMDCLPSAAPVKLAFDPSLCTLPKLPITKTVANVKFWKGVKDSALFPHGTLLSVSKKICKMNS